MIDITKLHKIDNWEDIIDDFRCRLYRVKTIPDWEDVYSDVDDIRFSWEDMQNVKGLWNTNIYLLVEKKMELLFMEIDCMDSIYNDLLGE